jgi:hypothetical protein
MKTIKEYNIVDHGIEHEQYFQGHGIAMTEYSDCATGCGNNSVEAFEDALDSLAQNGWDVSAIPENAAQKSEEDVSDGYNEEHYYYVSIDVKG